ncbi:ROK family protein [Listeria cossartiae subsp. cayugensis]|uniref:ROK family protein n=1 Tax=Listeria cossartiae TaxID=2838249 RepID=UPI00288085E4|nr:ROK family protein [Listeria cossartiae]MDT0000776.1 ROK family protein [Listeria cossartiae subsp. cayugensis]MDT0009120.1 ROK family protein [Listeria cossartiae subsp. cayugensis]MDT0030952.1 ROK family protein [Listeria cossartiae subsp. cayugensis]MDT0039067.1 ROK family protein [Listeria cossartiae subsp. cayugensis]MDT0044273.1 ROK family protein [Listeria cossartiae subsp. cayugensis]
MNIRESVIGIDLGGTKILIGEVTRGGEVLNSKSYPSDTENQTKAVEVLLEALDDYTRTIGFVAEKQICIGVGLVGRVDYKSGIWLEIEPGKTNPTPLAEILEAKTGLPVSLGNDVVCATMAEKQFGWGRETNDFIYLNVGTGLAAGFVVDGRITQGGHFNAGEIGHAVIDIHSDVVCGCGRRGCVERLASGLGIKEEALRHINDYPTSVLAENPAELTGKLILHAAEQKDELAEKIVDNATLQLANLIMNLVRTTDPECVILGGGVTRNEHFFQKIMDNLQSNTIRFVTKGVVRSKLEKDKVGLIGAAVVGMKLGDEGGKE